MKHDRLSMFKVGDLGPNIYTSNLSEGRKFRILTGEYSHTVEEGYDLKVARYSTDNIKASLWINGITKVNTNNIAVAANNMNVNLEHGLNYLFDALYKGKFYINEKVNQLFTPGDYYLDGKSVRAVIPMATYEDKIYTAIVFEECGVKYFGWVILIIPYNDFLDNPNYEFSETDKREIDGMNQSITDIRNSDEFNMYTTEFYKGLLNVIYEDANRFSRMTPTEINKLTRDSYTLFDLYRTIGPSNVVKYYYNFSSFNDLPSLIASDIALEMESEVPRVKDLLKMDASISNEGIIDTVIKLFSKSKKKHISEGTALRKEYDSVSHYELSNNVKLTEELSQETKRHIIDNLAGLLVLRKVKRFDDQTAEMCVKYLKNYDLTPILDVSLDFLRGKKEDFSELAQDVNGANHIFERSAEYFPYFSDVRRIAAKAQRGFLKRKLFRLSKSSIMMQQVVSFSGDHIGTLMVVNSGERVDVYLKNNKIKPEVKEELVRKMQTLQPKTIKNLLNAAMEFNNRKGLLVNKFDYVERAIKDVKTEEDGTDYMRDRKIFVDKVLPSITKVSMIDLMDANKVLIAVGKMARYYVGMIKRKTDGKIN